MKTCNHKLGFGLIPIKEHQDLIYSLAEKLAQRIDLSFYLKSGESIPHLTLFQGRFVSVEEVVKKMETLDFSFLGRNQKLIGLSQWAKKIIFLDCVNNHELQTAHEKVYHALFPMCEGKSADPQNFQDITKGQQKSFNETGYPFSLKEYLPHFTIAHIENPEVDESAQLDKVYQTINLRTITFERIVVYIVGELGRCLEFAFEKNL